MGVPSMGAALSVTGEGTRWNHSQNEELVLSHRAITAL